MLRNAFAAACLVAAALAPTMAADAQPARIQVGSLNCSLSSSVGLIVTSARNVACIFHTDNVPDEAYVGRMTTVGIDLGVTSGGVIVWAVFANTNRYAGMLAGRYAGATAEASLALGLGANVLVGGSNESVALQPVSIQGQVGFNIAAGVGELTLRPAQ
jgi:hypothetical protein